LPGNPTRETVGAVRWRVDLAFFDAPNPQHWRNRRNTNLFFIFGEGLASCGEFLQRAEIERKSRPPSATATEVYDSGYAALVMYADGFLTGANLWDVQNSLIGNSTDSLGRMVWIEKYCRAHSSDNFFQALISLRNSLKDEPEFLKDDHEFLKDQHD
jgi:hypothetical protein